MVHLEYMKDWEHQVSELVKEAIQSPDREVEVCEELCEFIMELVRDERAIGKQKLRELAEYVKTCWRPGKDDVPEPYK